MHHGNEKDICHTTPVFFVFIINWYLQHNCDYVICGINTVLNQFHSLKTFPGGLLCLCCVICDLQNLAFTLLRCEEN